MKDIQPLQLSDVHFWTFDVEKHLKNLEVFRAVLTKGEVVQSQKFKFDADRERYILAHGFKRYVLAHYLDIDPVEIVFFTGPQGKPYIKDSDIQFNLSHSSNRVVLGISKNKPTLNSIIFFFTFIFH